MSSTALAQASQEKAFIFGKDLMIAKSLEKGILSRIQTSCSLLHLPTQHKTPARKIVQTVRYILAQSILQGFFFSLLGSRSLRLR